MNITLRSNSLSWSLEKIDSREVRELPCVTIKVGVRRLPLYYRRSVTGDDTIPRYRG